MPKDKKDGVKGLSLSPSLRGGNHGLTLSTPIARSSRGGGPKLSLSHPCGGASAQLTLDGRSAQSEVRRPTNTSFGERFPDLGEMRTQLEEREAIAFLHESRRAWSAFYNRVCRAMRIFTHRICKGDVRKVTMEEFHSLWEEASNFDLRSRSGSKLRRLYTQMGNRAFGRRIKELKEQSLVFWADGKYHWGLASAEVVKTPYRFWRPAPEVEHPQDYDEEDTDDAHIVQPSIPSQEEGEEVGVVSFFVEQTVEEFWQTQQIA